jgi:hypothetical protein
MRDRAYGCMAKIVQCLITDCQIPQDKITLLKPETGEHGNRTYSPPEDGRKYGVAGATVFDPSDRFWYLGIRIDLTGLQFIQFSISITDQDGVIKTRGADGKLQTLDPDDNLSLTAFCESICDGIVQVYSEPKPSGSSTFGFGASY